MNRVLLIALLFSIVLNTFIYAVDKKYIPGNVDSIFSINLDSLSQNGEIDLQEFFNKYFMNKYASMYLEYRDDPFVAEVMTNRLNDYIDFTKASKIIFINGYQQMVIMFDIKNITELDKLMIKMASQEDKLVSISDSASYRYLALDEYNLISWNKEIFTVTLKLKDNYWYNEDLNKDNIDIANQIFINNNFINDEKFLTLDSETNDFYIWANLSVLSDKNSDFTKFLFGRNYNDIQTDIYKDAILTSKINFNKGNVDAVFDSYTPNYPYDTYLLRKQLSDNIYTFVNGENNYGFLSLAFNSIEVSKNIKDLIGDINNIPFGDELAILKEHNIDIYKFIELLGGDIFVSVWDNNLEPSFLVSASLTDINSIKILLEALSEEINNDIYVIYDKYCYIKDSILYISSDSEIINSIIKGEIPEKKIDDNKLNLAKNNTMSFYLELDPKMSIYGIADEYLEAFESIYLTSNILENHHTQIVLKINTRDKEKNSLSIIKSFIGL